MSFFPLWLFREFAHAGPRLIRECWRAAVRARRLSRLKLDPVAEVLAFLSTKTTPTPREEVLHAFPGVSWPELVEEMQTLEGVLFFRPNALRVTLTAPLRLEIRTLLRQAGAPLPEEPPVIPIQEPEQLSPADILGVSLSASIPEIKLAYRRRVKECHPDRFAGMDEHSRQMAEEWTKALNAAYDTLLIERGGRKTRQAA